MTTELTKLETFNGEFDFLPLAAEIEFGSVPMHPNSGDFQLAAITFDNEQSPAALWRLEAIRWRMGHHGVSMDLDAIAKVVARRIYEAVV